LHGFTFHNGTSFGACGAAGNGCSPTLSSQMEMIGTSLANNTYSSPIAANVDTVIMISTGRGRYVPQLYGKYFWPSEGTMIRNRSSHMPTSTDDAATTHTAMFQSAARAGID